MRELFHTQHLFRETQFYSVLNAVVDYLTDPLANLQIKTSLLESLKDIHWKGLDYGKVHLNEEKLLHLLSFSFFDSMNSIQQKTSSNFFDLLVKFLGHFKYRFRERDPVAFILSQRFDLQKQLSFLAILDLEHLPKSQFEVLQNYLNAQNMTVFVRQENFLKKYVKNEHFLLTPEFLVFFEEYWAQSQTPPKASPFSSGKPSDKKEWFHLIIFKMAFESHLHPRFLNCIDKQLRLLKKSLQSTQ